MADKSTPAPDPKATGGDSLTDKAKGLASKYGGRLGKVIDVTTSVVDVVRMIHDIEGLRNGAGQIATKISRRMDKRGNFREFNEAMNALTPEEHEFIRELLRAIGPATDPNAEAKRTRFQQEAALTGPEIADTTALLKKICGIADLDAALEYLEDTDYLTKPAGNVKKLATKMADRIKAAAIVGGTAAVIAGEKIRKEYIAQRDKINASPAAAKTVNRSADALQRAKDRLNRL